MDPTLTASIGAVGQQGAVAVIAVMLLWWMIHELKAFLNRFDEKLDSQSKAISRLLRALGEED